MILKPDNALIAKCSCEFGSDNMTDMRHVTRNLIPYANNEGADQTAHAHSLISTFVLRCLDNMIHISKTYAKHRSNQNPNPALKSKTGND